MACSASFAFLFSQRSAASFSIAFIAMASRSPRSCFPSAACVVWCCRATSSALAPSAVTRWLGFGGYTTLVPNSVTLK